MNFLYQQGNIIVVNTWHQEPVTQSEQLPCSSCHNVLTDQFIFQSLLCEFRIPFKVHKPVGKSYTPNNGIFDLLI